MAKPKKTEVKQTVATVETQEVGDQAKQLFHIHCDLPNASERISGVVFVKKDEGGVCTAEPVTEDVVALFDGIPGYSVAPDGVVAPKPEPDLTEPDLTEDDAPAVPVEPVPESVTEPNPVTEPEKTELF